MLWENWLRPLFLAEEDRCDERNCDSAFLVVCKNNRATHKRCSLSLGDFCGDGLSIVLHAVPQITRLKDTFYCALRHRDNELYNGAKKFACSKRFPVHVP